MDEKIIIQLRLLKKYKDILLKIRSFHKEQYLHDDILRGSAERYLQLAIETCINIGNRILSLEQFDNNIKLPETYADIFENLQLIKIIDQDSSENLKNMAKFRNRLVHMYWDLDNDFVYDLIQNRLNDFEKFMLIVSNYLKSRNSP